MCVRSGVCARWLAQSVSGGVGFPCDWGPENWNPAGTAALRLLLGARLVCVEESEGPPGTADRNRRALSSLGARPCILWVLRGALVPPA